MNIILVFYSNPFFESDYYRYFIDGLHSLENLAVYSKAPVHSPLAEKYSQVWKFSEYNQYKSIYPGASIQFFKWLVYLSQKNIEIFKYLFKIFALLFSFLIALIISKKAQFKNKFKSITLIIFHPLFVLEWYINLHYDFLLAFTAIALICSNNQYTKQLVLVLGFHIKYLVFLFMPYSKIKLTNFKYILSLSIILLLSILFYQSKTEIIAMIENIFFFSFEWEMNAGLFRLSRILLSLFFTSTLAVKLSFLVQVIAITISYLFLKKSAKEINQNNYWSLLFVFIVTSAVVNPWYLTWILPLTILSNNKSDIKYFLYVPILLSYSFYLTKNYQFIFYLEHILFLILWIGLVLKEAKK